MHRYHVLARLLVVYLGFVEDVCIREWQARVTGYMATALTIVGSLTDTGQAFVLP